MKTMRKWLSLLLALALVFVLLPQAALAADASGECGDGLTWTFKESTGELTISGSGSMTDWVWPLHIPWYSIREAIETVTIKSGVTSIGTFAFADCYKLKSVMIPYSVTDIGTMAFGGCTSLMEIKVGSDNGNYSSENGVLFNKDKTFLLQYPAGKAGEYQIPDSVTDIRHRAFIGCTGLTSVMIPDSVTDISVDAFIGCTALKRVTVLSNDCTIADGKTTLGDPDVTTIYGLKGSTAEAYAEINGYKFEEFSPFEDVMKDEYYYEPVQWAVGHDPQITNGTSATTFSPDKTCTRAQVVTFLWRAKGCPEPTLTLNPFEDVKPDQYYYKAVLWAVQNSITNGVDKTHFGPDKGCTRAQVVTFLWRTESQPEPTLTLNPFTDVLAAAYYYKAVLWAVQNGITTGTGADKFSPDSTCTRGQIVTFLYRDLAG